MSPLETAPTSRDWITVRTIGYDGSYNYGDDYDRRACGGVVHIQERAGRPPMVERRAVTTNGRYSFVTPLAPRQREGSKPATPPPAP